MTSLYDEIRIALHGIWNRRWLALAVAWGICILGWLVVSLIPNSYQSTARVFVQTQSILPGKIGITPVEQQKDIDRVRQTLTSVVNLEKVVRGTDLSLGVSNDRDVTVKATALQQKIKVVAQQDNLFEISATMSDSGMSDSANAKLSTAIVQKLIDIFVEENMAGNRVETGQTLKFYDAQLVEREKELRAAEARRVEFEQKFSGLLPGIGSISQRMEAARNELNQIEPQLIAAQTALASINGQLAGTPANISTPGVGGGGGIAAVQGELAAARSRGWTDNHPDVIAMKRQIAAMRAAGSGGASAGTSTPNPAYMQLRSLQAERGATASALQARKSQIQADLAAMTAKQTEEPGVAAEQDRLTRDYEAIKAQYDKLVKDRDDVRLRGDMQSETDSVKFSVIDPPSAPRVPTSPNRPLLLLAVLIVGIGGGIGTAFALGQVQTSYPTAERLARASGLPVIGAITETLTDAHRAMRKQKMRLFTGASAGLVGVCLLLVAVEFIQRGLVA